MNDDQAVLLPPDAIQAAAKVLDFELRAVLDGPDPKYIECNWLAKLVLAAAAPVLRAQGAATERERIRNAASPLWVHRDVVKDYAVPAELLDGGTDDK